MAVEEGARRLGVIGTGWPAALRAELVGNLIGDVSLQVLVAALWYWHLRSNWLVLIWVIRWIVIGGIVLAFGPLRRRRRERAVGMVVAGHLLGVVATVAVVPEIVPLTMFILVGDLLALVRYGWSRRRAATVIAVAAGGASALTLQHWTGLADRAPRGLFIAFIVGHAVGTGWFHAVASASSRRQLLVYNDALTSIGGRVRSARDAERTRIASALANGPIAALGALRVDLSTLDGASDAEAAALVDAWVARAQAVAAELRELAHGVYPDGLRQHGIATALRSLGRRTGVDVATSGEPSDPGDESSAALYFMCAALVEHVPHARTLELAFHSSADVLVVNLTLGGVDGATVALDDVDAAVGGRIQAANADASVTTTPTTLHLRIHVPVGPGRVTAPAATAPSLDAARVVRRGMVVAGGLAVAAAVARSVPALVLCAAAFTVAGAGRALFVLRRRHAYLGVAVAAAAAYAAAAVATAAAPESLPVAALLVMTPLLVGLELLPARGIAVLTVVQSAIGGVIALIGLLRPPADRLSTFARPVTGVVLPLASVLVIVAIGYVVTITHGRLVAHADQLRSQYARLVEVSDDERRSIERDLHDGGQQQVVAIALQLRVLARSLGDQARRATLVRQIESAVAGARSDLRLLAAGTSPLGSGSGLADALRAKLQTGAVALDVVDRIDGAIDESAALAAYYCCVEGAQNALKHASASRIRIVLWTSDDGLHFEVSDDGAGFDPSASLAGVGLRNLLQRVESLGGRLTVRSQPGGGTTLEGHVSGAPVTASRRGTAAQP